MPALKGTRPPGGSRKGVPNKITADVKSMILGALQAKGGQAWLEQQMDKNPVAYMALLGKILPTQAHLTGDDGEPLNVIRVQWISPDEASEAEQPTSPPDRRVWRAG
jgi:hypothetical protein